MCCLYKSLYGLKHASRQWFAKCSTTIQPTSFVQSKAEYSLFICCKAKTFTSLLIYIDDDIFIIRNNIVVVLAFKKFLNTHFLIKDLDNPKYMKNFTTSIAISQ